MECIFPIVISSEFRIGQYRDDDHREDAPTLLRSTFLVKISVRHVKKIILFVGGMEHSQIIDITQV